MQSISCFFKGKLQAFLNYLYNLVFKTNTFQVGIGLKSSIAEKPDSDFFAIMVTTKQIWPFYFLSNPTSKTTTTMCLLSFISNAFLTKTPRKDCWLVNILIIRDFEKWNFLLNCLCLFKTSLCIRFKVLDTSNERNEKWRGVHIWLRPAEVL